MRHSLLPMTINRIHFFNSHLAKLLPVVICLLAVLSAARGGVLNIVGSPAINLPVADAAQILRSERTIEIHINTNGGSNAGIAAVGDGTAQIGMSTHAVTAEDRADSPEINFKGIYLGEQVVALGVSKDVWTGGVRGLSRRDLRWIYEGRIKNWKQVGGPDEPIVFFIAEEGRGIWEVFIEWMYGDSKRAPLGRFPTVNGNDEARNSVEFTRGSMSLFSPKSIDGKSIYPLALEGEDKKGYFPVVHNIVTGKYPLMKPIFFVVDEKPTSDVKVMVDFMLGERGRELLNKYGYFTLDELKTADPEFTPPQ